LFSGPRSVFSGATVFTIFAAVLAAFLVRDFLDGLANVLIQLVISLFHWSSFGYAVVVINGQAVQLGAVLSPAISLLIVIGIAYWLAHAPASRVAVWLGELTEREPSRECPRCLSTIFAEATRCPFCTSEVAPTAAAEMGRP